MLPTCLVLRHSTICYLEPWLWRQATLIQYCQTREMQSENLGKQSTNCDHIIWRHCPWVLSKRYLECRSGEGASHYQCQHLIKSLTDNVPPAGLAVSVAARRERDRETKAYSPDLIACEYTTQRTLYNQHRRHRFAQCQQRPHHDVRICLHVCNP